MKTQKLIIIGTAFCLTILISYVVGYHARKAETAVEDFNTYQEALVGYYGFPEERKIELADFLKARYYYFANRVPPSVLGEPYDFGSVDFKGMAIGQELTTPKREYELFKAKKVTFKKPFEAPNSVTNK